MFPFDSNRILADNLRRLMEHTGDTQLDVAKRGGLAQRSVSNVLSYGTTHETSPTIRTVDGLATAFKLDAWHLFFPQVPVELALSRELDDLLVSYLHASPEGRQNIKRIAEGEARFASIKTGKALQIGS
jgi:transcriptional regulator with XRE-family HTH domain